MQLGIASLWSLLEAVRAGAAAHEDRDVAVERVCDWVRGRGGVALAIENGALLHDGVAVVGSVATYAAVHGLRTLLRGQGIRAVDLAGSVSRDSLLAWAEHVVSGSRPVVWSHGIHVELAREAGVGDEPVARVEGRAGEGGDADSRLRAVFLQHSLIAGLPPLAGIGAGVAKAIVEGIVDRLLRLPHGLDPLMLLQQDDPLLRRSTAVAVFTARFAHHAGWPEDQLADLGVAGLLHDIGMVIDPETPGPAGFRWLLERGDEPCWLRSALVARRWREASDAFDVAADLRGAVGLVRLAVAAGGAFDLPSCHQRLQAAASQGAVPDELLAAAFDALGGD